MTKSILRFTLFMLTFSLNAQSFSAKLIDTNKNPVPFATVQTGENTGVITNEEGYFTIYLQDLSISQLTFSCMGFSPRSISIDDIKKNNNIVVLEELVNQLDQVYLLATKPNADSIIIKVNRQLTNNYENENKTYNLFFRNTSYTNFGDLEFKITKASGLRKKQLAGANKSLDSLTNSIKNNKTIHFKDYLADLHLLNKENSKLNVVKATRLVDRKKDASIGKIQGKAQNVILKYLDTTLTYKLKTGIIKVEGSLSLNHKKTDSIQPKHEYKVENLRNETHELLNTSQIYDNTTLRNILSIDLYKFNFENVTFFNDELVYIIKFKPKKSKAKYTGTLYIADESYAVIKAEYAFAKGKRGEKLNLKLVLGIKYVQNVKRGTIIFKKNEAEKYQPHYIKEEYGNYFYVNRPIKFIENSPQKNKVGFNFLIEGNMTTKNELLFLSEKTLSNSDFNAFVETEMTPYQNLKKYDASIWKTYNALEPLEELKTFKAEDN